MPAVSTPRPAPGVRRRVAANAARLYTRLLMKHPPQRHVTPSPDGRYGPDHGEPLPLLLLGDSLARGVGARAAEETLGARLAHALSETTGSPVLLRVVARPGSTTAGLHHQLDRIGTVERGIAVLIIGSNDTLIPTPIGRAARHFERAVERLRAAGRQVVVMPCPDPGNAPGFRAPVRWAASHRARRLARMQCRTAERHGALTAASSVDDFRIRAAELLGPDRVHPSPLGYAEHAVRVLPTLLEAAAAHRSTEQASGAAASPGARTVPTTARATVT
ncbi:SGNH/GDSL hydrolase family protein [Streptomyces sp. RKAG337]|uniref:SGNH/GDSL hydrolase family protein n=1 Tax=Streptomyces sp. RKAG337 TaxID=2893404 RepID=UPI002034064A|nr:SGNH/GDSL hydrolase family protein [Streptomyces sp. RKAG337]MCM2424931.1 SGNH/GDSL hydrolase family protein [Streptomyces sp. RKAG337]